VILATEKIKSNLREYKSFEQHSMIDYLLLDWHDTEPI
jgi:hypothetical protein